MSADVDALVCVGTGNHNQPGNWCPPRNVQAECVDHRGAGGNIVCVHSCSDCWFDRKPEKLSAILAGRGMMRATVERTEFGVTGGPEYQ